MPLLARNAPLWRQITLFSDVIYRKTRLRNNGVRHQDGRVRLMPSKSYEGNWYGSVYVIIHALFYICFIIHMHYYTYALLYTCIIIYMHYYKYALLCAVWYRYYRWQEHYANKHIYYVIVFAWMIFILWLTAALNLAVTSPEGVCK